MKSTTAALAVVAVLALAGCGSDQDPAPAGGDQQSDKSPLAEYLGEGFGGGTANAGGFQVAARAIGPQESSEEQLAKQRKIEDGTAACMKAAGFEYVAVPPEQTAKSKFTDAFKLPPDKFAQQYGYGISTIDWSKADDADAGANPNTKIRDGLSASAKKAYDKALNGPNATESGGVVTIPGTKAGEPADAPPDLGCRGKAADQVYGQDKQPMTDFQKFDSLFKDVDALRKRIDSDQAVTDATTAWADCLADAGHSGFTKLDEPRQQVQQKLDALTGNKPSTPGGPAKVMGLPSFDKVDAAKLTELRKFETDLAVADQKCKADKYDAAYRKVQYAAEKEFVEQHKAELESYRDETANR